MHLKFPYVNVVQKASNIGVNPPKLKPFKRDASIFGSITRTYINGLLQTTKHYGCTFVITFINDF
jgi:hypothetical protein